MCCKNFWTRIVSFVLALTLGFLTVSFLQQEKSAIKNQESAKTNDKNVIFQKELGSGQSGGAIYTERDCYACNDGMFGTSHDNNSQKTADSETKSVQIISKPRATYTDAALDNQIQGTISLRVAFLASGKIGSVSPVTNLPNDLTEQAIVAARNIRFQPATRNGKPISTTKTVQYNFTIY